MRRNPDVTVYHTKAASLSSTVIGIAAGQCRAVVSVVSCYVCVIHLDIGQPRDCFGRLNNPVANAIMVRRGLQRVPQSVDWSIYCTVHDT